MLNGAELFFKLSRGTISCSTEMTTSRFASRTFQQSSCPVLGREDCVSKAQGAGDVICCGRQGSNHAAYEHRYRRRGSVRRCGSAPRGYVRASAMRFRRYCVPATLGSHNQPVEMAIECNRWTLAISWEKARCVECCEVWPHTGKSR